MSAALQFRIGIVHFFATLLIARYSIFIIESSLGKAPRFFSILRNEKFKDSIETAKVFLDNADIVVTPGVGFGKEGEGYVRMALTVSNPSGAFATSGAVEMASNARTVDTARPTNTSLFSLAFRSICR